jgi:tetratricopeptide (TPR) repeat protein
MSEKIVKKKDKPEELIRAKQLIDESKFDEAEQLVRNFEEKEGHTLYDIVLCHLLNCELLFWRSLWEDAVELAEQTYKESLGLGKNLLSVDILLIMANALVWIGPWDKLYDIIKQGEELLKALLQELPANYKQREAYIAFLKGWYYTLIRDADQALKHFELSISLREELGAKPEIAVSLIGISWVFTFLKLDYDRALKFSEQANAIAEESCYKWLIGYCFNNMATINALKGDLDRTIMLYEQSLTIFNDLNNTFMMARILNVMGEVYRQKGELNRALECLEQAMALNRELGKLKTVAANHDYLIQILIEKGDLERAQQSLHSFEQLNNQLKDKQLNSFYLLNKALILKKSSRTRNRAEAEGILKQLLEDEDSDFELILKALPNLCELLLTELRLTNDLEVLDEINPLITRLLDIAEKSHSYSILCETYLLQAKLALIALDLEKARRLLTKGQQIADKYGLSLLATKISNEHDELLKKLDVWEKLKEKGATLTERMELSRLNEQMGLMVQKRIIDVPEASDEEPVLLLIVSEGGRPIFSQSFIEDQVLEDHLFGGFFTAINSFINEKFSEGLDRAIFGEHTLLMNSLSPFLICYVYKGQSYSAQHRIKSFINEIQSNEDVWDTFGKYYKLNKEIQLKDIPSLEPMISEIFMNKTLPLNS